jgi:hypothetical protein
MNLCTGRKQKCAFNIYKTRAGEYALKGIKV